MKKIKFYLIGFLLSIIILSNAQEENGTSGLFNGQPSIAIPVWSTTIDGINIGVSISYSSSGIKVENKDGCLGMGWNLNAGGFITREVKDIPDEIYILHKEEVGTPGSGNWQEKGEICGWLKGPIDYQINGEEFIPQTYLSTSAEYWENIPDEDVEINDTEMFNYLDNSYDFANKGEDLYYDHEPDMFHFSFLGRSGSFMLQPSATYPNGDYQIHQIPFQDLIIDYTEQNSEIVSFTITDESGNKYYFEELELTHSAGQDIHNTWSRKMAYNSGWYLTKIQTTYNNEIIYTYASESETIFYGTAGSEHIIETPRFSFESSSWVYTLDEVSSHVVKPVLQNISTKYNELELGYNITNRQDIGAYEVRKALDYVAIKTKNGAELKEIKKINFRTQYFKEHNASGEATSSNVRLYLASMFESFNGVNQPAYNFGYNYDENQSILIPNKKSNSTDYWGYYNGYESIPNTEKAPILYYVSSTEEIFLYPQQSPATIPVQKDGTYGRDKRPNLSYASRGILTSINNPFGGTTNYTWELNQFSYNGNVESGNGLRIAKIEFDDSKNGYSREYSYHINEDLSTTSGSIGSLPKYHFVDLDASSGQFPYLLEEGNINSNSNTNISYSQVTEYYGGTYVLTNGETAGKNGKIVYHYNNAGTIDNRYDELGLFDNNIGSVHVPVWGEPEPHFPSGPALNYSWARGKVSSIVEYDYENIPVSEKSFQYKAIYKSQNPLYVKAMKANRMLFNSQNHYYYRHYPIILETTQVLETTNSKQYYENNEQLVSNMTYNYDNLGRISSTIGNTTDNQAITYKYAYPDQYVMPEAIGAYQDAIEYLVNNHITNYVIEKVKLIDGNVVTAVLNDPILFNNINGYFVARNSIFKLRLSDPKPEANFTYATPTTLYIGKDSDYIQEVSGYEYNDDAIKVQHTNFNGVKEFKVLDTNQRIIAKGFNADLDNVVFDNFEADNFGLNKIYEGEAHTGNSSTKAYYQDVTNFTYITLEQGKTYKIRFWVKKGTSTSVAAEVSIEGNASSVTTVTPASDGTWTIAEKEFTATLGGIKKVYLSCNNPGGLSTDFHYIDNIQIFPVGASFAMYTHDPIINKVTSVLDSRGDVLVTEYDIYGREIAIRDKDGNIISEKRYNYAANVINTDVSKVQFDYAGGTKNISILADEAFSFSVVGDQFVTASVVGANTIQLQCASSQSSISKRAIVYLISTENPDNMAAIEVLQSEGRIIGSPGELVNP